MGIRCNCIFFLLNGEFPVIAKLNNGGNDINFTRAYSISQRANLIKLTNSCLDKQHEKRPTIEAIAEIINGILNM